MVRLYYGLDKSEPPNYILTGKINQVTIDNTIYNIQVDHDAPYIGAKSSHIFLSEESAHDFFEELGGSEQNIPELLSRKVCMYYKHVKVQAISRTPT